MKTRPKCGRKTLRGSISRAFLLLAFFLTSCTSYRDVLKGDDGIHKVLVARLDQDKAKIEARKQAKNFCEKDKKQVVSIAEKTNFGNERSTASVGMGGGSYSSGMGVFLGSAIPVDTERFYETTITFQCE